jgi:S1-C subfamily serine protease
MDHLTKQQLVLLALLLSFMTSLATGIVTVSLMDQAPAGVTRTVSQVIEKTIQQVTPQNVSVGTVTLAVDDQLANAVASVSPSVVKIEDTRSNVIVGLGLIVSKDGIIMTDKSAVNQSSSYTAILSDGTPVPINIVQSQAANNQVNNGDVTFFNAAPLAGSSVIFVPITSAAAFTLGQTVFSLAGTSTAILGQGIITDMAVPSSTAASSDASSSPIGTSISDSKTASGGPLFDIRGNVIGIRTSAASGSSANGATFEPIAPLLSAIPVVK